MKQLIKINEHDIARMVKEAINELSFDTMHKAANAAEYDMNTDAPMQAVREIEDYLYAYADRQHGAMNPQLSAARNGLEAIKAFIGRKGKQNMNIRGHYEDRRDSAENELFSVLGQLYPQAIMPNRYHQVDFDKISNQEWNDVLNHLSPQARDYAENEL